MIPATIAIVDTFIFILTNAKQTHKTVDALNAGEGWSDLFIEAADMRNLITMFRQGLSMADKFEKKHAEFNRSDFAGSSYKRHVCFVAEYTPTLIVAGIIGLAWTEFISQVKVDGERTTSVALFVTLISAVMSFETVINNIFLTVFTFSEAIASIKKISALLNARTRRKDLYDAQMRRNGLIRTMQDGILTDVSHRVIVHELEYTYVGNAHIVVPKCSFSIDSSLFVSIIADREFGKNTLMRLLGRQLLPQHGFISYPPHWRMRLLTAYPLLFDTTLLQNIKFGIHTHYELPQIYAFCEDLGMSKSLLDSIQMSSETEDRSARVGRMGDKLASTDRILISLARAFLNNVDLLLLNNTLDTLTRSMRERIIRVLKSFITHRGVVQLDKPDVPMILKKQKTVICTTRSEQIAAATDYQMVFASHLCEKSDDDKSFFEHADDDYDSSAAFECFERGQHTTAADISFMNSYDRHPVHG
uniref:ABC transporter domain-containing protein n=1 Tax=Octactis speculum TaxID=3111310 RepID=A0A7S2D554_9STRA